MNLLHHYRVNEGSTIQKQEYGYDLRDRRAWTQRDGGRGDTYAYQADSQLIDYKFNANNPRGVPSGWAKQTSFAYDHVGNRTTVNDGGTVTNYDVNHANQYRSVTGSHIHYGDGRGNITQWKDWTYTYDAENRMLSASNPGVSITFSYDPAGRLARRTVNGNTEYLLYDKAQQILRYDSSNNQLEKVIWGLSPDEILSHHTPAQGYFFYHSDLQGNVAAVTDSNRGLLESYLYDPYGNTLFYNASGQARPDSAYGVRFLFTGQERMAAAGGLYNYKNRFYLGDLGRFLQTDPLRIAAGDMNLYRYCFNNPINLTDPDGQLVFLAPLAVYLGKMAVDYAVEKGIEYAKDNLLTAEQRVWAERAETAHGAYKLATGNARQIVKTANNLVRKEADDVARAAAKAVKKAPDPLPTNRTHGGPEHSAAIQDKVNALPADASDVRVNQKQVDVNGNVVGDNRPDVAFTVNGQRVNHEVIDKNANTHAKEILENDKDSVYSADF